MRRARYGGPEAVSPTEQTILEERSILSRASCGIEEEIPNPRPYSQVDGRSVTREIRAAGARDITGIECSKPPQQVPDTHHLTVRWAPLHR